jgi:hypothetical protein
MSDKKPDGSLALVLSELIHIMFENKLITAHKAAYLHERLYNAIKVKEVKDG